MALVRGINVGPTTRVPMADLRKIAEGLGLADVATVLNSGNLLFSPGTFPPGTGMSRLADALEAAIAADAGFAPPVLVRSVGDVADVARAARAEFPDAEGKSLVGIFLSSTPGADIDTAFAEFPEQVRRAGDDALVIHYVHGQAQSKLDAARLERILGVDTATARNINTIERLAGFTNH